MKTNFGFVPMIEYPESRITAVQAKYYITDLYHNILQRDPTDSELVNWLDKVYTQDNLDALKTLEEQLRAAPFAIAIAKQEAAQNPAATPAPAVTAPQAAAIATGIFSMVSTLF
jgi:hypothetical protein